MSYTGKKARLTALKTSVRVASAGAKRIVRSGIVSINVVDEKDKQGAWTKWRPGAPEPVEDGHVQWKLFRHPVNVKDRDERKGSCGLLIWSTAAEDVQTAIGGRMDTIMSTVGTSRNADYVSYQVVADIK
jgi:hypothetical protein